MKSSDEKPKMCNECGSENLEWYNDGVVSSAKGITIYWDVKCKDCGNWMNIIEERPKEIECPRCDKKFACIDDLDEHECGEPDTEATP